MKESEKKMMLAISILSLIFVSGFSGCLGTKADFEDEELGAGLIADELGRPSIDPSIYGQNLIWDNDTETLTAISSGGGSDGYRSESSILYVVKSGTYNSWTVDGRVLNATDFNTWDAGGGYQQVVTVAKSGGEYTAIQDAVDSIVDANATNRYVIRVMSGVYVENVTCKDYVDILGAGRTNTIINGSSGAVLTFPATKCTVSEMGIVVNYGVLGVNSTAIISNCTDAVLKDCDITVTKSGGDFTMNGISVTGGSFEMFACNYNYTDTGATTDTQLTQSAVKQTGVVTNIIMDNNKLRVSTTDTNDDLAGIETTATVIGECLLKDNIITVDAGTDASSATGIWAYGTCSGAIFSQNRLTVNCSNSAYGLWIDSDLGGAVIDTRHNEIIVTSAGASAQSANVAVGDTWNSEFDKITASSGYAGAGTKTLVTSEEDGDLTVSGTITGADGTFTNNITVDGMTFDSANITAWDTAVAGLDGYVFDGKIHNSKGNNWTISEANLDSAISDMGDSGGIVTVGGDITFTSELSFTKSDLILDFLNNDVTLTGDISFVNITDGVDNSVIRNARVNLQSSSTSSMIVLFLPDDAVWADRLYNNVIDNIYFNHGGGETYHNYTVVHLDIQNNAGSHSSMLSNKFTNIWAWFTKTLIKLECDDADGWGNGNNFENMFCYGCVEGIVFDADVTYGGGYNFNTFNDVKIQCGTYTTNGVKNIDGEGNIFDKCLVWDWNGASSPEYEWSVASGAINTKIISHYITIADVHNLGVNTKIEAINTGSIYQPYPYDYILFQNSTHTMLMDCDTGLTKYSNTNAHTVIDTLFENSGDHTTTSVLIKEGTYVIPSGWVVTAPYMYKVSFIGEDQNNCIFQAQSGGTYTTGMFSLYEDGVYGQHNVTFRNLCFDGNSATGGVRGIWVGATMSCDQIWIDNCVFKGFDTQSWSTAIYSASGTSDVWSNIKITNSRFYYCLYAIRLEGDSDPTLVPYADILYNDFFGCTTSILLDYGRNCTISGNDIIGGTTGIIVDNTLDSQISLNTGDSTNGIDEQGSSNYNIFSNNNFRHSTTPIDINGANSVDDNNIGTVS